MSKLDPSVVIPLTSLVRGLERERVQHCFIGALVPELLLNVTPLRRTNDADAVVLLSTLEEFEALKVSLRADGFEPTRRPYRLEHRRGGWVDLLPYSEVLVPSGTLTLPPDTSFNMVGFNLLAENSLIVSVDETLSLRLAPLPLYALLKLVAYSDRRLPKDPASVLHCLRHYEEDSERRYGPEHEGERVSYDVTTAFLLGEDGRSLVGPLRSVAGGIVAQLVDPDSPLVFAVAREENHLVPGDEERNAIARLFRAFRDGAGLAVS